mmetsp:Transcript_15752/g.26298  ORF Transcript_15752/g.26298 Transcript_15752/m.26298 type:complete len:341 (+) Transcript_15752:102-1124(+)
MEAAARLLKKETRKLLKARVRNLPAPYCKSASQEIFQRLESTPAYKISTAVFCFLSMPQEVQTIDFIDKCLLDGKRIFVPKVTGGKRTDMQVLEVMSVEDIHSFPKSSWGIPEPPSALDEAAWRVKAFSAIDLVVVPGVGFDAQCRRMGHGRGYYDTFFAECSAACVTGGRAMPTLMGVSFDEQVEEVIPTTEHDRDLDFVVTPSVIYTRGGKTASAGGTSTTVTTTKTSTVQVLSGSSSSTTNSSPVEETNTRVVESTSTASLKTEVDSALGSRKWADAFATATKVSAEGDSCLSNFTPSSKQEDFGGFRQPDGLASFVSKQRLDQLQQKRKTSPTDKS